MPTPVKRIAASLLAAASLLVAGPAGAVELVDAQATASVDAAPLPVEIPLTTRYAVRPDWGATLGGLSTFTVAYAAAAAMGVFFLVDEQPDGAATPAWLFLPVAGPLAYGTADPKHGADDATERFAVSAVMAGLQGASIVVAALGFTNIEERAAALGE